MSNKFSHLKLTLPNAIKIASSHDYHSDDVNHISILNLDKHTETNQNQNLNKDYYLQFKKFVNNVVNTLIHQVGNNIGDIIQFHLFEEEPIAEEDKAKFMEMFNQYKKEYSVVEKTEKHTFTTNEGNIYPLFMEDLYRKNSLPYENFEKQYGITKKIEDQTDEEFLETLGKRVNGLEKCKTDPNYSPELKNYFSI